ncbi:NFACT RNA binding domain-containing protein [Marinoscillum furvescens]|uniref:Putative ribosome quality control (RQC) complex YloA/Tae2 family protein n=1 Tax=Marinoscillum furvescens DSM 4134 TaxID=1122208 RepID=A0A3D9L1D5_MARFU|nr:NFACT RNA binding domain-containing protein [Marinoscillum furvescens]RED96640.1 putative ribosome quality control (RQC) complex YloA/Tae2 family protein [Marinoscillum furvescens DSM 4134]
MFHNYFFLKRFATELNDHLAGHSLLECFSQNKDELILGFSKDARSLYLRANLEPSVALIDISEDFHRAKKNSIDLFDSLLDQKVTGVFVFNYERSIEIQFGAASLIFKMHGTRSNILLSEEGKVTQLFRNSMPADKEIVPLELNQIPDLSKEAFEAAAGDPQQFLPALGKEAKQWLKKKNYATLTLNEQWDLMNELLDTLENNSISIYEDQKGLPYLSLLEENEQVLLRIESALEAATFLFRQYTKSYYLAAEKQRRLQPLRQALKKTKSYLNKTKAKLEQLKNQRSHEEIANIIMANLHQIPKGQKAVTLQDFYTNENITIKLNPELTPQKNAENLYRKSKNQQLELNQLEENLKARQKEQDKIERHIAEIEASESVKELRKEIPAVKTKKNEKLLPYHLHEYQGYQIMVGRNSRSNDELSLKVANKNDLWLHAKDVAGSHVVIRHQAGKNFPKPVIEFAARLAAGASKRKTDSLCPVIYTPKKYLRKRKGDPPGAVVVEKEEVIMVEPWRSNST